MNEKKEKFSAKTEIKADFNKIITKLINESPDRLKVLFDGEIKTNLIQPLFKKINESIDKTSINSQTLDFKFQDIIDDAVTNLLYDTKFASDIKDLYSSSFTDIFKSFKDIDPKNFHKQFVDQFNKKIEKSVEDLAVFKADIKLSDINVFQKDEESSDKFKALTNKILDQLEQYTGKITISDVGITQDNLLTSLFNVSPSLNANNKRKYNILLDKTLDQITKAVDSIKLGDKGVDQTSLLNVLFNDSPEMGFTSRWKFNSLREDTLDVINNAVKSLKNLGGFKLEGNSISTNYLFDLLFNETETGGFLWKWKFNSLKEKVIDILRDEVGKFKDGFGVQTAEPITTSYLLKLLFEDTDVGGILWKRKYNSLREKVLEDLKTQVDKKFDITGDPLSTQDLIQLLFSDTPEIDTGFFGLIGPNVKGKINELREKILNKISLGIDPDSSAESSKVVEDEDAKKDKDERDHINRTVSIHEDSLTAIEKSFLASLKDSDIVKETTQNKRFNQLMSFLKEDLLEAIKESSRNNTNRESSSSSSIVPPGSFLQKAKDVVVKGATKARSLIPSAATIAQVAATPVAAAGAGTIAATVGAGAVLGYGIGKLIQPGVEKLQEIYDDRRDSKDRDLALLKSGKALIDKQKEWLSTPDKDGKKLRPNGEEATINTAARDIDKYLQQSMIKNKASDFEIKEFKEYAKKQLGQDIFTVEKAPPVLSKLSSKEKAKSEENKSSSASSTQDTSSTENKSSTDKLTLQTANQAVKTDQPVLDTKKTQDITLKPTPSTQNIPSVALPKIELKEDKIKDEAQLNTNQPLSVNFTPLIDNLNMSFAGFGRTIDVINSKLDAIARGLSDNKSSSPPIMLPPPAREPLNSTPADSKNNVGLYRNDYIRSTSSFAVV
jgi:hypothetical protein